MTQGNPLKQLFFFALPLMLGNVFQQLYTVVDTAIVGQGVGMNALAALGTLDWFLWLFTGIAQGFTQGFGVRVSQKYGEGDKDGLKIALAQAARLSFIIAIIGLIISQVGMDTFLRLMRVPEELKWMAEVYARIILGGFPIVVFFNYCASILRAIGNSKTPLKAMIVASITNICLDLFAVYVLEWGVAGAALATISAQVVAGIVCLYKIVKTEELRFGTKDITAGTGYSKNLVKIGVPVALQNIIIALGGITVQMVVNGFEISFIAGFTATNKLYGLLEVAALSYGFAVTTYVGQNYGAKKYERIKSGMRAAIGMSIGTSLIIETLMILFGRKITMLFISSEVPELMKAAGDTAYLYLLVMSVCLPVLYLLYVYQSALRGLGNTVIPMLSGIIEFVLRVSISLLIGYIGLQNGIFGAEVAAWMGAMLFMMFFYYKEIRKHH